MFRTFIFSAIFGLIIATPALAGMGHDKAPAATLGESLAADKDAGAIGAPATAPHTAVKSHHTKRKNH